MRLRAVSVEIYYYAEVNNWADAGAFQQYFQERCHIQRRGNGGKRTWTVIR